MSRVSVTVTPEQKAELKRRADLSGMSMSAYLKEAGLGAWNAPADDPDVVWFTIPRARRERIIIWLFKKRKRKAGGWEPLPFDVEPS